MKALRLLVSQPEELVDSDCACPTGISTTSLEEQLIGPLDTALWQTPAYLYRDMLPAGHTLLFDPYGVSNVAVLNASALELLDAFSVPTTVSDVADTSSQEQTIRQFIQLGLLRPPHFRPSRPPVASDTLTAWLHVTNACNLRCTYCYIAKTEEPMDEAIGRAAAEAVFRSARLHGFSTVKLKYAGGEATLNFRLVRLLHEYAKRLASRFDITLRSAVLSNGVALSRVMIEYLRDEGIRLMISLDGVGETHDAQRRFATGRGSFKLVARGIDQALAYGLQPDLSITVTGRNAHALPNVVAFALDRGLRFNLNFFRDTECATLHADLRAENERLVGGIRVAFAVIEERLPHFRLLDGLVDRSAFNQPHELACGAGHSYLMTDQHGGVSRCQMEIENSISHVMALDPLQSIRLEAGGFQNIPVTEKEGCKNCSWRFWCAGGCSLLTFRATGRYDVQSPYCEAYKQLYPAALRLEGLRLLRWATLA